jgi:DNA-binding NarL/FixJ family response regulator
MISREVQNSSVISVVVADDHPIIRDGVTAILRAQDGFTVVGEAANGLEAVELWRIHHPRITLMDLSMPVMDGVAAIELIRAEDPKALIIILTTYDGEADIYRGVSAGAKGYVLKDVPRTELVHCLRTVHRGEVYIPASIVERLATHVSTEALTGREVEVLALVAEGVNNRDIGSKLFISEGTVKSHIKSILAKLDATSRTEAVAIAGRRGLLRR